MPGPSNYYPGVYRGTVYSTKDPLQQGRLKLRVPQLFADQQTEWAWPIKISGVETPTPDVGQGVWVMFEGGDPAYPIWHGVFGKDQTTDYKLQLNRLKPELAPEEIQDLIELVSVGGSQSELDVTQTLINIAKNRCYGSFFSTSNQLAAANTRYFMPIDQTAFSCSSVSVTSGNQLRLVGTGVFNVQFSAQFSSSVSQDRYVDIWLMKNGQNVENSNSRITTGDKAPWSIAAWNFFIEGGGASDYWQIAWSVNGTGISLHSEGPQTSPDRPSIPSVILTVHKVK